MPRVLWSYGTKDAVMHLLVDAREANEPNRVFASLANGTVVVFERTPYSGTSCRNLASASNEEKDTDMEIARSEWKEATVCNKISPLLFEYLSFLLWGVFSTDNYLYKVLLGIIWPFIHQGRILFCKVFFHYAIHSVLFSTLLP